MTSRHRSRRRIAIGLSLAGLAVLAVLASCTDFGETFKPAVVAALRITSPASPAQVQVGSFVQFAAEARDADDRVILNPSVTWVSSDTLVASIDLNGRAVGRAVGTADIRVKSGSVQSTTVTLQVQPATQVVAFVIITSHSDSASVARGDTIQFTAEARDANQIVIPSAAISWISSNTSVATIDAIGSAIGRLEGETRIRAASDTVQSAAVTLRVTAPAGPSFAATIQPIFDTNHCSTTGCHAGAIPAELMDLSPGRAYAQIVNVRSTGFHEWWRVKPGDPDSSLIYVKVSEICAQPPPDCPTGERMPKGFAPLSPTQIEAIRTWIAAGARP